MKFRPLLVFCVLFCLVNITSSSELKDKQKKRTACVSSFKGHLSDNTCPSSLLQPISRRAPWELSQILPALCQLPPVRGPCRGLFYRYFYNDTSSECERFTYSGCQGNANNFETTEICVRICKPPGESSCRNRRSHAGDWGRGCSREGRRRWRMVVMS
ncbi:kunitz-type protease inhibitor 3 [Mustela putorius furo]|uniref:Kunitz-type protease inhibitor 3 n=1 Tax=Mustela putorius furo TaxID=9669 RepID=A0A8U0S829_MUSPF|nr:kunitz-type protease inhibitor 3 [Mustela putorius furo]